MDYFRPAHVLDRRIAIICNILFLAALWPLTHRYNGLTGDAALYAVQALSKIYPNLAGDLFLQNNSQDNYTVFPAFYAGCIRWLGLRGAAITLFIALKICFFWAAWALASELFERRSAFLSTVTVMVIAGCYGGYSVFSYSEDWLTARTLAETMVLTALWLYVRNIKIGALFVAFAAFFIHPLVTLPALAVLFLLWLPLTIGVSGAVLGVTAVLGTALLASHHSADAGALSIMDRDWLEIVRERSVFLFPQLWSASDWEMNALPFVSLAISATALRDPRIQKLSIALAVVGVMGLAISLVAATIGPVGLFIQGQAWRWVWITRFTSIIFLAPTLLKLLGEGKFGPLCALLMVFGWTFSPLEGLACLTMALLFRSARHHLANRGSAYIRWTAIALAAVLIARVVAQSWSKLSSEAPTSGLEAVFVTEVRSILGFGVIAMALAWAMTFWLERTTSRVLVASLATVLLVSCIFVYPGAFRVQIRDGDPQQIAEFANWRRLIAPADAVFVVPAHNSATFAWLTLERPSYLTVDQSAGVVFSRETALEVRRRSDVLLPLMDPDWRLLSQRASSRSGGRRETRALTRESLLAICNDPKLRFVVAREDLGFDAVSHDQVGNWKDWKLYDCKFVQSEAPQT
jgi:hypothetical protein